MAKFYFTYEGTDATLGQTPYRQIFKGGWTEVEADDALSAQMIYNDIHPQARGRAALWFYNQMLSEESFRTSGIAETGINGYKCVERILLKVDILERGAVNA